MKPRKINYYINLKFLSKALLGYLAYYSFYPRSLTIILNKFRGVNIAKINGTYIASNVLIDSLYPELVTIEEGVYLTRGVIIITHFNPTEGISKYLKKNTIKKPVLIKKHSFIGVNSILLPGVTIGENVIIGAGSVVTKDIPDYAIAAGNPARVIGDIRKKEWSN